ncbi:MAG: FAD-binding oxidoreductase [Vicinamibacterales bacterium]
MPSHRITARQPLTKMGEPDISTAADLLKAVSEDAAHYPNGHAAGVARPTTESDVATLLLHSQTVLPIGAQSSLTGGATPMGDIVMDMQRFDRILAINDDEAIVQPGVPLTILQATLERSGKYYPPVPTFHGAFAGGVVATNAAGAATFKYGTTRDWVRGLTVVLASGQVLELTRGETIAHPDGYFEIVSESVVHHISIPRYNIPDLEKCSAGYFSEPGMDLIDLFIGSEGTLGIITEITFAVIAPTPNLALVWIPLPSEQAALELTWMLRQSAKNAWRNPEASALDVSAIEYLDTRCLEILQEDGAALRHEINIPHESQVALLVQVELPTDSETSTERAYDEIANALGNDAPDTPLTRLCRLLSSTNLLESSEISLPSDRRRQAQLIAAREAVPDGVNRRIAEARRLHNESIEKTAADMIVPFERSAESLALFKNAFEKRQLDYAIWGHVSDGNVHPNVIPQSMEDVTRGKDAILECGRDIIKMGGSPLAEHGVGRNPIKQELLRQFVGNDGIAQMRAVKSVLDPLGKLAPGVIFSKPTK